MANQEFSFGGFNVPADCKRIFITAELESSNGDPRIQPTGFPDLGPVLYPDPSGENGNICLIESEASMANRLEEVSFSNKYEGTLRAEFAGLPYLRVQSGTGGNTVFRTSSTLDGHRFASDFLAKAEGNFGNGRERLSAFIIRTLGMSANGSTMPIARIPEVFELVMALDPMSLIHGFQISNEQISFVGLRLPRALTASTIGFNCERVTIPGVKFSTEQAESQTGQAIFQKQRITASKIEARFSIDVGLLASLRLDPPQNGQVGHNQRFRFELLVSIALWKVASLLQELQVELSLRSECKLRLKSTPKFRAEGANTAGGEFPCNTITAESFAGPQGRIVQANLPLDRHPMVLEFNP
jgi:CRISPR-associated protein Csb1